MQVARLIVGLSHWLLEGTIVLQTFMLVLLNTRFLIIHNQSSVLSRARYLILSVLKLFVYLIMLPRIERAQLSGALNPIAHDIVLASFWSLNHIGRILKDRWVFGLLLKCLVHELIAVLFERLNLGPVGFIQLICPKAVLTVRRIRLWVSKGIRFLWNLS